MSKKGIEEHLDCGHHAQYLGPAIFWTLLVYHIHHTLRRMSSAKECIGLSMEVEARNDRTVCLVARHNLYTTPSFKTLSEQAGVRNTLEKGMRKHILDVTKNLHKRNTQSPAFRDMVMRKLEKYELIDTIVRYLCRKLWSRKSFRGSLEGFLLRLLFVSNHAVENNTYINKANAFVSNYEAIETSDDIQHAQQIGVMIVKFLLSLSVDQLEEMIRKQSRLKNTRGMVENTRNLQLCTVLHKAVNTELYT